MPRSLIETLHLLSKGTRMESIPAVKTWKRRKRYSCCRWCLPCRLAMTPSTELGETLHTPHFHFPTTEDCYQVLARILNASISQITSFKKTELRVSANLPRSGWRFPKIGVPQNGWFIVENPIKMGDLGGTTIFGNTRMFFTTVQPERVADSSVFSSAFVQSTLAHPELS